MASRLLLLAAVAAGAAPEAALFWNMSAADERAGPNGLSYDERLTAFAAQGSGRY